MDELIIDRLLTGAKIIRRYQSSADIATGHDCIFFGNYDTREEMKLDEQQQMEDLGWYEDEEAWTLNI